MLTRRMMIQALADRRAGLKIHYRSNQFSEPFRSMLLALETMGPGEVDREWLAILVNEPDGKHILAEISAAQVGNGNGQTFRTLAEIAPELPPISWLWPGWIPNGFITLLGAVPGAGKSLVALDLARRVIAGERWPDGSGQPVPGKVIYVDAEFVPQLAAERAATWKMDTSRLFMMLPEQNFFIDFCHEEDRDRLIEMVYAVQPALIVIDSMSSISSAGENNVDDVRGVLGFLNELSQAMPCGLLLIHHLRKRGPMMMVDDLTIDDFRGSSHIIAMSRSVLGLSVIRTGPEVDRNGPRRLEMVKTNLGSYPDPLGIEFQPLYPQGVRLVYGDEPQEYHEPTKTEECMEFILDLLADGPRAPKEVIEEAKGQGYSRDTVFQARKRLEGKVQNTDGRKSPNNQWELARG